MVIAIICNNNNNKLSMYIAWRYLPMIGITMENVTTMYLGREYAKNFLGDTYE